jgi:hypothetical protein
VPFEHGLTAFWRGNFTNVMSIIPKTVAQYLFFDNFQRIVFNTSEKHQTVNIFIQDQDLSIVLEKNIMRFLMWRTNFALGLPA